MPRREDIWAENDFRKVMSNIGTMLIASFLLFSACSDLSTRGDADATQESPDAIVQPEGPYWAAFIAYQQGVTETRYTIGPFLKGSECQARIKIESANVQSNGGVVIHSTCVLADITGAPYEPVVIPEGRDI